MTIVEPEVIRAVVRVLDTTVKFSWNNYDLFLTEHEGQCVLKAVSNRDGSGRTFISNPLEAVGWRPNWREVF